MNDTLSQTMIGIGVLFGTLFLWCICLPYFVKVAEAVCCPQPHPARVPEAVADPIVQVRVGAQERDSSSESPPTQLNEVVIFVESSGVKLMLSGESYDDFALALALNQDEAENKEDWEDEPDMPTAAANNILIMNVEGTLEHR